LKVSGSKIYCFQLCDLPFEYDEGIYITVYIWHSVCGIVKNILKCKARN